MKMNRSTKTWQIIGVLVTLLSIGWGIYQHTRRQEAEALSIRQAGIILRQAMQITGLERDNKEARALIAVSQIEIDSLTKVSKDRLALGVTHKLVADRLHKEVEQLKSQLHETPDLLIDDAGHIDLFLEWTSPDRKHPQGQLNLLRASPPN